MVCGTADAGEMRSRAQMPGVDREKKTRTAPRSRKPAAPPRPGSTVLGIGAGYAHAREDRGFLISSLVSQEMTGNLPTCSELIIRLPAGQVEARGISVPCLTASAGIQGRILASLCLPAKPGSL